MSDCGGDCREEGRQEGKAGLADIRLLLSSAPSPSLLAASLGGRISSALLSASPLLSQERIIVLCGVRCCAML